MMLRLARGLLACVMMLGVMVAAVPAGAISYNLAKQLAPQKAFKEGYYDIGGWLGRDNMPSRYRVVYNDEARQYRFWRLEDDGSQKEMFGLRLFSFAEFNGGLYVMQVLFARDGVEEGPPDYGYGFLRTTRDGMVGLLTNLPYNDMPAYMQRMVKKDTVDKLINPEQDLQSFLRGAWQAQPKMDRVPATYVKPLD